MKGPLAVNNTEPKGRPCRWWTQGAPIGLACKAVHPPAWSLRDSHSLIFSLQHIPGHGQQGQEAGLARVLELPEPLLVLGPRHVVLELLWRDEE